jgi:hypothetical protein
MLGGALYLTPVDTPLFITILPTYTVTFVEFKE